MMTLAVEVASVQFQYWGYNEPKPCLCGIVALNCSQVPSYEIEIVITSDIVSEVSKYGNDAFVNLCPRHSRISGQSETFRDRIGLIQQTGQIVTVCTQLIISG